MSKPVAPAFPWSVCTLSILAASAFAGPATTPSITPQSSPPSLIRAPAAEQPAAPADGAVRAQNVEIDLAVARQLRAGAMQIVNLAFFPDAMFDVRFDRINTAVDGGVSGAGRVEGVPNSIAAFAARGDHFAAFVHIPGRGTFELQHDGNGPTVVTEIAGTRTDHPLCGLTENVLAQQASLRGGGPCDYSYSSLAHYSADDGSTVDLMVVYTEDARDQAGGAATIESRIDMAAAATNQILADSLVPVEIRVIRKALITYTESTSAITDLNRLVELSDGHLDFIHADRDTHGADLVMMWVADIETGGVAYQLFDLGSDDDGRFTFSVMRQDNWPFETMAHELGHNFGCQHDRDNLQGVGFFVYSYGYREPGNVWKTVMAYPPGTTVLYFSNPTLTYTGPLGNHGPMGVGGVDPNSASDCARTIRETAWTVANFRPSTLSVTPPSRIYVRASASPGGDGTSWAAAFQDVQEGISHAVQSRGAVTEVWVAAGTYRPDRGRTDPLTVRKMSFRPVEGVTVYGGFDGTETMLAQRDVVANETILDGDIGSIGFTFDDSWHVIDGTNLDATAVLDGFTIRNGRAVGFAYPHDGGGGMKSLCGSATIRNCKFVDNHAVYGGGAVANRFGSDTTFEGCAFESNSADNGGAGVFNEDSVLTMTDCSFTLNAAPNHAAIDSTFLATTHLTDCTFTDNLADWGGAVGFYNSTGTLTGCEFTDNVAASGGGALITGFNSTPTLIDCDFVSNEAFFGGAWYAYDGSDASLSLCDFSDNIADDGAGAYLAGSSPDLSECTFVQNHAGGIGFGAGGGLVIRDAGAAPTFTDCLFDGNTAGCCGGAVTAWLDSAPTFENAVFIGNHSNFGGAVWYASGANAEHLNCRFLGNNGEFGGGAAHTTDATSPQYVNCEFSGNTANDGSGGVFLNYAGSGAALINSTLANNTAMYDGGGILNDACTMTISNSVLWQNVDWNGSIESSQIGLFSGASVTIDYSIVQGWTGGLGGLANVSADPSFRDADGDDNVIGTLDDNLRVQPNSPAVDSGNNAAVPGGVTTDLAGNPRFADLSCAPDTGAGTAPIVDRGPYEFAPSELTGGDFDCDGDVDVSDFGLFAQCFGGALNPPAVTCPAGVDADIDNDGDVDVSDFALFAQNFTGPL